MAQLSPGKKNASHHAVLAGFLGWTLDAFDFLWWCFYSTLWRGNSVSQRGKFVWTTTATLAMRPLGALLFGLLADRYGRRIPLMANVIYFSIIELACGFAPNLRCSWFAGAVRDWHGRRVGVGASLAMESAPTRLRGILSGILQSGYSIGYLLAAIAARFLLPHWGWRPMF